METTGRDKTFDLAASRPPSEPKMRPIVEISFGAIVTAGDTR
jgi:hypothetical protein